jgi:diadenosine tetraphosphate (Ap4A) HIT family hydrolase
MRQVSTDASIDQVSRDSPYSSERSPRGSFLNWNSGNTDCQPDKGCAGPHQGAGAMRSAAVEDCLFCKIQSVPPESLPWHDRPLALIPGVGGVIAGLGAFVPGYVLVFPEQHVESVLRIRQETSAAFRDLMQRTARAVQLAFGPPTLFEHGSCPKEGVRRSACLAHAHIHILPGSYDLRSCVTSRGGTLGRSASERTLDQAGYLYLHEPMMRPVYGRDPGMSQFLRRQIATALGMPDEWDYLLFPRLENVSRTIKSLKISFEPVRHQSKR